MAGEISAQYATGNTLYSIILTSSTQSAWIGANNFQTVIASGWPTYASSGSLTEATGTGLYFANFPPTITTSDKYSVLVYKQLGGSPVDTDTLVAEGVIPWTGSGILVETGDSYARIGPTGSSLTSLMASGGAVSSVASPVTIIGNVAVSGVVTVGTNLDKTGYSLTGAEHVIIALTDMVSGMIAQGYTLTRASNLDNLDTTISSRASASSLNTAQATLNTINVDTTGLPSDASIRTDVQTALTSQGYTTTRATYLDNLTDIKTQVDKLTFDGSNNVYTTQTTLSSGAINALLDMANAVEVGLTVRQALRLISAVLGGVLTDAHSTPTFLGAGVGTTRVTSTVDVSGDRSSIILTL